VQGSLRLHGGLGALQERIAAGLAALGFSARLATAPTPRAALWLSRGEG
jgi:protein ImuB